MKDVEIVSSLEEQTDNLTSITNQLNQQPDQSSANGINPKLTIVQPKMKLIDSNLAYQFVNLQGDFDLNLGFFTFFLGILITSTTSFVISLSSSSISNNTEIAIYGSLAGISRDGYCLPACVRMILAYWGDIFSEDALIQQLKTRPFGTPISNIKHLTQWGYDIQIQQSTREGLQQTIQNKIPVIVRVWTEMLPYWQIDTSHVVVVIGFDTDNIYVNDPALSSINQPVLWDAFLASWAEYDELAITLQK